jgi:prepilin-type N-terminal cleavage/methylation domain-containing protein
LKNRGFTLLELLLTLTIFAAIMGLLMNVFFQFKDQSNRFSSTLDLRQEARILELLLRQDLQSAVFLPSWSTKYVDESDGRQSGIVGIDDTNGDADSDRIHLHVNRPARFLRGLPLEKDPEIHEVSYYLEEVDGHPQFKRREQFYIDPDITDGDDSISLAISENVISFDLKYYQQKNPEPMDEWGTEEVRREMTNASGIPAGVAVTLKLRDSSGERLETQFQINLQPDMGTGIKWGPVK